MAYGQMTRYRRSKRRYSGRRYGRSSLYRTKRRKKDGFDMAREAWTGVKKLYRMVNVEYKHHDVNQTDTPDNSPANVWDWCVIAQGDTSTTRDGISIKPQNCTVRWTAIINASATSTVIRFVVFRAKAENDQAMVPGNIFGTTGVTQHKIFDKRYNTKVLHDQLISLSSQGPSVKAGYFNIPLDGHINFDVSDTTGDDKEAGGLYAIIISNEATNTPSFQYSMRLTYTDN